MLDHPAPTVELRNPPCLLEVLDPVAGQQPPVRGRHTSRRIYFARLDNTDGLPHGHAGLESPVLWFPKGDVGETHADPGLAFLLSGTGRQFDRMVFLWPVRQAGKELASTLRQHTILSGPDQKLHAFGSAGKHLEYVTFPVGNHRHPCRQRHQACTRLHAVNPALALFVAKSPLPRESFPRCHCAQ